MKHRQFVIAVIASVLSVAGGTALAADQLQIRDQIKAQDQTQTKDQEVIFGRDLMTKEELAQHRNQMRAAKTVEEREQIRNEHHKRMLARAKERGVTIPEEPVTGMGAGMGPGGGRNR